jgi:putative ABC transport system permease protein
MVFSQIKITIRHIRQNKLYDTINIIGLAIGISCVLLAVLYWKDERNFDSFHQNSPNLYRITTNISESKGDKTHTSGGTGQPQGPAFKAGIPEVVDYVRVLGGGLGNDVVTNQKSIHLQILFADENFFNLFSFPLLYGNPNTVLRDINAAVITESAAMKLFNSTDVVGKEIQLDADPSAKRLGKPMLITGVVKSIAPNSSIQFELLLPMKFMQLSFEDKNWLNAYLSTFVLLNPNADLHAVIQKFNQIYSLNAKDQLAENIKTYGYDPAISYGLQPITDIHLNPLDISMESGVVHGSNPIFSLLFMGIAVFILLMASVNFINISISDSLKRAKEVGVRKITGGSRSQIIMLFLIESAILCLFAFVLALLLTAFSLPVFNKLTGKQITLGNVLNTNLIIYLTGIFLAIILFTGFYPAWIISGFSAREVLYSRQKLTGRNVFGKSLVVFQFSLAIFLIITTLVYYSQMHFIRTKDLGYNPHEVIQSQIPGDREINPIERFLKDELAKEPNIKSLSFGGGESIYAVQVKDQNIKAIHKVIDENYLSVMEIPLLAGRNLSPSFPSDSTRSVIVNEAFVKAAGLTDPIGTALKTDENFDKETKTIIGVINDFHVGSLREPIQPMVMFMNPWYGGSILVKMEKTHLSEGLSALENAYRKAIPQAVFQYHFLDELNARLYEQEQRWQEIISIATAFSIAICCMGLFGLAHLATHQRVKEIGIRKVLGASVTQIVTLFSGSFLKLVIIAILIASPFAWYTMNQWLRDFAYRVDMGVGVFITAGLISVSIALIAVGSQAVRAASVNPVSSLRSE